MKEIKPLTALRGFAAVWVAAYHFAIYTGSAEVGADGPTTAVLFPGTFGVDVFFILSGFVISYVYRDQFRRHLNSADVGRYVFKRFARIYPVYFFTLTVFVLVVMVNRLHPGILPHPEHFPLHTLPAQYLAIQSWGIVKGAGWILPAWSISAEFFAYLLFPIFAFAFAYGRARLGLVALLIACLLYVLAPYDSIYGYPALIRVVTEFGIGMFLLESLGSRWMQVVGRDSSIAVALALTVGFLLALPLGIPRGLFFIPAALIVAGLATNHGLVSRVLSMGPFQYFGRISYSLYATHVLALSVAKRFASVTAHVPDAWMAPILFGLSYLVFAGVGAALTYHVVERSSRRWLLRETGLKRGIPRPS
jgi:peptidoglycan/LPS O-acetylase OafA/YrhL